MESEAPKRNSETVSSKVVVLETVTSAALKGAFSVMSQSLRVRNFPETKPKKGPMKTEKFSVSTRENRAYP